MTDIDRLKEFKAKMAAVARKNGDKFETTVTFDELGYHIEVIETGDSHSFLSGTGSTFSEAADNALKELPDALESWGYIP